MFPPFQFPGVKESPLAGGISRETRKKKRGNRRNRQEQETKAAEEQGEEGKEEKARKTADPADATHRHPWWGIQAFLGGGDQGVWGMGEPPIMAQPSYDFSLSNSFIKIKSTYRKIHPRKVYKSMVFSNIQSCTTMTTINFSTFSSPLERNPVSISISLRSACPRTSPALGNHLSVLCLYGFAMLDISYKWEQRVCGFLWLASFTSIMLSRFVHVVACST